MNLNTVINFYDYKFEKVKYYAENVKKGEGAYQKIHKRPQWLVLHLLLINSYDSSSVTRQIVILNQLKI
jgi:hypothetical protein